MFLSIEYIYAFIPKISGLLRLNGYKSLTFSMTTEETEKIMSDSYNGSLYGNFVERIDLRENSIVDKYENKDKKLAYYLFFFKTDKTTELYRVDIATQSSINYNHKQNFYYPVTRSAIESILEELKAEYGDITDTQIKSYSYNNIPFEEYVYWFLSNYRSVSLSVMPDIGTLKNKVPLFSYRISFYDEILIAKYIKK